MRRLKEKRGNLRAKIRDSSLQVRPEVIGGVKSYHRRRSVIRFGNFKTAETECVQRFIAASTPMPPELTLAAESWRNRALIDYLCSPGIGLKEFAERAARLSKCAEWEHKGSWKFDIALHRIHQACLNHKLPKSARPSPYRIAQMLDDGGSWKIEGGKIIAVKMAAQDRPSGKLCHFSFESVPMHKRDGGAGKWHSGRVKKALKRYGLEKFFPAK